MIEQPQRLTVLVTGGCGGIGMAVCRNLISSGHVAVSLDRSDAGLPGIPVIIADMSRPGAAAAAVAEAAAQYGPPTALVNTIGYYGCHTLGSFSWDDYELSMQVNARAPIEAALAWASARSTKLRGVIVNVSSAAATLGSRDLAYSTAKGALEGATRSLARSLAPSVSVFGVAPGLIDTPMSQAMPVERRVKHAEATLLGRAGQPVEVADLICFLLTARTEYLTGTIIPMTCGLLW